MTDYGFLVAMKTLYVCSNTLRDLLSNMDEKGVLQGAQLDPYGLLHINMGSQQYL